MNSTSHPAFRKPTGVTINGRTSTITNAFVNSIIPIIPPTIEQVDEALSILGMNGDNFSCAYCGDAMTEWDHLNPLVRDKKPTGFVSEIHNLVPSCGKCNQSKGNKEWREWIVGDARLSPKTKGVQDLDARIGRLEEYERRGIPRKHNFEEYIGPNDWAIHWENLTRVWELLKESQELASTIKRSIENRLAENQHISGFDVRQRSATR